MISAAEARELTKQSVLLRKVGKNIKKCAKKGMSSLFMQIPASATDELRETLKNYLNDLGYYCKIPPRNKECEWSFDVIEVRWEDEEE